MRSKSLSDKLGKKIRTMQPNPEILPISLIFLLKEKKRKLQLLKKQDSALFWLV